MFLCQFHKISPHNFNRTPPATASGSFLMPDFLRQKNCKITEIMNQREFQLLPILSNKLHIYLLYISYLFNWFKTNVSPHTETNLLLCRVKQLLCLYMNSPLVLKGLRNTCILFPNVSNVSCYTNHLLKQFSTLLQYTIYTITILLDVYHKKR